jgi:CHAT domain-containing protein/Tfp pilus assembly protein PilF
MRFQLVLIALLAASACRSGIGGPEQLQDEAVNALRSGNLTAAQSRAERGLDLVRSQSVRWQWTFRLIRAESLILQLKLAEARIDLSQPLPSAADFESLRARQKYLLAKEQVAEGSLLDALSTVDEGRHLPSTSDIQLDLDVLSGQIRSRLGRRAEGESLLLGAVEKAASLGDRYHQALALNDLGMGRLASNRFDEALPWFERVLSLTDLEPFTIYALSLHNAGICYARLGAHERALALQRRSVEIHERRGPPDRLEQALGALGRTYALQGDIRQALPFLRRAFSLASTVHADADAALLAGNLADAYIDLGQWDEAARFNDDAIRISRVRRATKQVWYTLNAADIAKGRGRDDEARQLYENAIAASADEPIVRWNADAGLARVALAGRDDERAADYFERALHIIEQSQSDLLKTDYKLSYLNNLIQFYREYVDALIGQGRIDRALEVADSSRGRVLAERQRTASPLRVTAARFRGAAERSGKAILFYWLQPRASWLWVVTAKAIHLVPLPAGDQIEALVREHQEMIGSALADPLASEATPGAKLYKALVAPAAHWIPNGASVLVVPDGGLHGLNFETLPVSVKQPDDTSSARRHYWIEDVQIQIVPSLGLLADAGLSAPAGQVRRVTRTAAMRGTAPPDPATPALLLIGSPAVSDAKFPALSYASAEMAKVAANFGKSAVVSYEGPRASPVAYRNAGPDRFRMIHFTAHAAVNVESPLDSAVILAAQDGAYKLYARDIAELPLHAELVTVSACRSAGERAYSGEGLIGFAWAFLRAGARRVIAGLWDVDDQSTAGLMDGLYARLAAGAPPSRALREAKLAMMRQGGTLAKPYYWGPFELFTIAP